MIEDNLHTFKAVADGDTELPPDSAPALLARAEKCKVNPSKKTPPPETRFSIGGVPVCTPANLCTISASVKSGKSALNGALLASTFATANADCLGAQSSNPNGWAVIHFDSEQSPYDSEQLLARTIRRAGAAELPPWILSYCLTGWNYREARALLPVVMEYANTTFQGIHSVLVDGAVDLVADPNDQAESNGLVAELHALAIQYNCPILSTIHLNPGSDGKTRGHLGSQLERKSETNLRLAKDGEEIVTLWSDKSRREPIAKSRGICFAWSDEAGYHVTVQGDAGERRHAQQANDARLQIEAVFNGRPAMRYGDLQKAIEERLNKTQKASEHFINRWFKCGGIQKTIGGLYEPARYED